MQMMHKLKKSRQIDSSKRKTQVKNQILFTFLKCQLSADVRKYFPFKSRALKLTTRFLNVLSKSFTLIDPPNSI